MGLFYVMAGLCIVTVMSQLGAVRTAELEEEDLQFDEQNPSSEQIGTDFAHAYFSKRGIEKRFGNVPLCNNHIPPCYPDRWIFKCKVVSYVITCKLDHANRRLSCNPINLRSLINGNKIVCCSPKCP